MDNVFAELSIIIAVAVAVSLFMRIIRQPLIIGYIVTGLLVGPTFFDLIKNPETIDVFSEFGIALLLFIVGLGLNPRIIKEVGRIAGAIAFFKILFTTSVGFLLSRALGFEPMAAFLIGVGLSFSSTIVILKLLGDKKELTRLYGKISIGFLLVEDVIATLALVVIAATASGGSISAQDFGLMIAKFTTLLSGLILVRIIFVNNMGKLIAKSQDFLFLFAIGWALGIAALFQYFGFSLEIGALIAGVVLASLPYSQEISSRLKVLRDFFIVLFFISLGSHLEITNIGNLLPQAALLSILVLVGNPILVMTVMGLSGYTKKTSFKTGMTGSQVSEFSLILLLLANKSGIVGQDAVSLLTIVALITIGLSTYMIIYSETLYIFFERYLRMFERKHVKERIERRHQYDLVLIGYHKGGHEFLKVFKSLKKKYIVVDYDPAVIDVLESRNVEFMYGDVTDMELLEELNLEHSRLIVSTITDLATNLGLAQWLEKHNPHAVYIATADTAEQAAELYEAGAAYVVLPHYIGSEKIGSFLRKNGLNKTEFKHYREKHLAYLQTHHDLFSDVDSKDT
jgi:Kef-type K+ transport system membrane component KefB